MNGPETLTIATAVRDEIVAHSLAEAPNECCGMVGGGPGRAEDAYRARNSFESPTRYEVHPTDQLKIMNAIEEVGQDLVAIYHSHTRSAAYPSQTDINLARNWPDPVYLICSVEDPDQPELRGFLLANGKVVEVELAVE